MSPASSVAFSFWALASSGCRTQRPTESSNPVFAALAGLREQSPKFMASTQPRTQGNILGEKKAKEKWPKHSEYSTALRYFSIFTVFQHRWWLRKRKHKTAAKNLKSQAEIQQSHSSVETNIKFRDHGGEGLLVNTPGSQEETWKGGALGVSAIRSVPQSPGSTTFFLFSTWVWKKVSLLWRRKITPRYSTIFHI